MGEYSLVRRGGVWWIRVRGGSREILESTGTREVEAAREILRERRHGDAGSMRLSDLRSALIDDYRLRGHAKSSRTRIAGAFRNVIAWFENCRVRELTSERLASYASDRLKRASRDTVRLELSVIQRGMRLLHEYRRIESVPKFPSVRPSDPRRGFFEDQEIEDVCARLPGYLVPLIQFLNFTGWRKMEAQCLEWRQVDLRRKIISLDVGTTKNRRARVFPYDQWPDLERVIVLQRDTRDVFERVLRRVIQWVFFYPSGEQIVDFRRSWDTACRGAGVPGRHVHDLRRTAVRRFERAGVPRAIAMQLTGHLTESIYRRYAIVSERDLSDGVARVARQKDG